MRSLKLILIGFILFFFTFSCVKEENNSTPALSVNKDNIVVCADGGRFIVPYLVENRKASSQLSITSTQEWISGIKIISDSEFSFDVLPNDGFFDRAGEIFVEYPDVQYQCKITIRQESSYGDNFFHVDMIDSTEASVTYSIISEDESMPYLCFVKSKEEYYSLPDDQERFRYEMDRLNDIAQKNGITLQEILRQNLKIGDSHNIVAKNLVGGVDYCIYVFGVNESVELLTPFVVREFTAPMKELLDIEFQIDFVIDGNEVLMMVDPSDDEYPYVCDAYAKDDVAVEDILSSYQAYINDYIALYEMFGKTASDAIKEIGHIGKDAIKAKLEGYTDYLGFVIAVDMDGQLISDVTVKEFTTGHPKPSDNIIVIEIKNIKSSGIEFSTTASNEDQYAITVKEASLFEGMTDEQILDNLVSGSSLTLMKGSKQGNVSRLKPSTKYLFFAFGYSGGVATTRLFSKDFITSEESSEKATFELVFDKYFDGTELSEIYPEFEKAKGKAVLPTKVVVNEYADGFMYNIYAGNWMDKNNPTDEDAIDNLITNGITTPEMTYYVDYGKEHTIIGFAYDAEGYAGEVFRKLIVLTEDGVSPVEEYKKTGLTENNITTNLTL